jgi:hypothetical protein
MQGAGTLAGGGGPFFRGSWLLVFSSVKECEIIKSQITNQKSEISRCPNFLTGPAFPVFPIPQRKSGCPLAKISRGQFFRGSGCWFLASVKECEIIKIANHKSQI